MSFSAEIDKFEPVKAEFYIDDEFRYEDTTSPFSWRWNERSLFKKKIMVKAHLENESIIISKEVVIFNLFPILHLKYLHGKKSGIQNLSFSKARTISWGRW